MRVEGPEKDAGGQKRTCFSRAFAVKVDSKRLPDFLFSGILKGRKGHNTHRCEIRGTNQLRKTGKQEVVLCRPLPQTLSVGTLTVSVMQTPYTPNHSPCIPHPKPAHYLFHHVSHRHLGGSGHWSHFSVPRRARHVSGRVTLGCAARSPCLGTG